MGRTTATRILVLAGAIFAAPIVRAGANEGGVIILHVNEALSCTSDQDTYCDQSGLVACTDADVRADAASTVVFFALAAFPAENSPRLVGVAFGVDYDATQLTMIDFRHCADAEGATTDGWPGPGEGTGVVWNKAETSHLVEFYWFAGYALEEPATLELRPHPTQGGYFLDDGIPGGGKLDPIADYGMLGFGAEGYLPCPGGPVPVRSVSWGRVKTTYR